ncbi:alpha/beta hydrolase [Leptospira langatensis]|uniref:Alpha/beta hydrolase n=1 Tax=Leptospira langatensis TaxID=2484983 RepID=A0A5F1ZQ26_9LEPT|nr:alpha/beta hydrolase [Leptospira langatensis]TGK01828.1 alpha/beta hydrolase [Leptospira langatensis]TGL39433.1 alpha/beta hydrolase [Leptospira langatensis]
MKGLRFFQAVLVFSILAFDCRTSQDISQEVGPSSKAVSSLEKVEIGGTSQWILMRGKDAHKPVLLILHGGPGAASIGFARYFYKDLENDFIVVNWDQRGSGKSFSFFLPDLTPDDYVSDTHDVVNFLKKRFDTPKVFLMGHSWGGYIGALYANRHPENLHAYIGIGPVVRGEEGVRISYNYILEHAKKDPKLADQAKDLSFDSYMQDRRHWLNALGVGLFHGEHTKDESSFLKGLMSDSPEYSLLDIITYLPGIWKSSSRIRPYFFQMDLFKQAPEIKVPVYFFSGRYDYYTPVEILERYTKFIKTPKKNISIFENCAHAPHFELPKEFSEKLTTQLLLGK